MQIIIGHDDHILHLTQDRIELGALVFSGGKAAFGTGGYDRSTVAELAPVEFIQRTEKRDPSTALAVIIDTSGSMSGTRIELAKQAVGCGMYTLFEAENGRMVITRKPKMTPVKDYLMAQGRFRHFTDAQVEEHQKFVNDKWKRDEALAKVYQELHADPAAEKPQAAQPDAK